MMRLDLDNGLPIARSNVGGALASAQRLARLTEYLLDIKLLDEGLFSLRLAPVDLAALSRETAESLGTGTVPVQTTGEPSLVAVVDEARIRQGSALPTSTRKPTCERDQILPSESARGNARLDGAFPSPDALSSRSSTRVPGYRARSPRHCSIASRSVRIRRGSALAFILRTRLPKFTSAN